MVATSTNLFKINTYTNPGELLDRISPKDLEGAKVTFINMPIREQMAPNAPPMGPAILAARLQSYGVETRIIDLNAYRIKDEESRRRNLPNGRFFTFLEAERLIEESFQQYGDQMLIGLSGLITTLHWQEKIAEMVRRLQPQAVLVAGGGLATEFREILFHWIPELDGIVHSEGEDVIVKMAYDAKLIYDKGLKGATDSGKLKPYFIGTHSGRARFSYDGGRTKDLDSIPFPAWDLFNTDIHGNPLLENYIKTPIWGNATGNSSATPFTMKRSLTMISSRGCPFACKFCFRGAQGERNYGMRSSQNIIAEIVHDKEKYNTDFIGITDDNFMVNPKRIIDLAEQMKPVLSEMDIHWGTHGRLDEAADLKPSRDKSHSIADSIRRVDKMYEAGCRYIGFGAESASSYMLEEMGKGGFMLVGGETRINGYDFPMTMVEGIKNTKAAGIHANCTWIMGYPGENLEHLKTSVAFIKWQEEHYTQGLTPGTPEYKIHSESVNKCMFVATAYPGTELFKHPTVREKLSAVFGLSFDEKTKDPLPDDNLKKYVEELGDASKVLVGDGGTLYYGNMDLDQFKEASEHVNSGNLYKILDM